MFRCNTIVSTKNHLARDNPNPQRLGCQKGMIQNYSYMDHCYLKQQIRCIVTIGFLFLLGLTLL